MYKLTCIVDRQQQQLAHILQTLSSSEEYSQLTPQQLQTIAMSILVKEQQKQQVCIARWPATRDSNTSFKIVPG